MRALQPYSCSSRCATTSNCSCPTAPSSSTRAGHRAEDLDRALLAQLREAGLELLGPQRVGHLDAAEHLGREEGQAGELQRFALGQRVAELQHAVVGDADDVAGEGLVEQFAALAQERDHGIGPQLLAAARHLQPHAALEVAAGHAHEGDAVAVRRVHVGLDLEDDAGELRLVGLRRRAGSRRASPAPAPGRRARRAPRARRNC